MHWIDFSKPALRMTALPEDWTFENAERYLPARDIAAKGDDLLLSMRSDTVPEDAVRCVMDHVNLSGKNPLRGANDEALGVRFPDMSHPYELAPFCSPRKNIIIRAGQNAEHPMDAPEAADIVYQTIIARHQGKKVYALIYGSKVKAEDIIQLFQGEDNA
jgi:purine nucleoside phosphorylase